MAEISSLLGLITDDNTRQALIAQMENMFDNAPDEERLIQEIGNPTKVAVALIRYADSGKITPAAAPVVAPEQVQPRRAPQPRPRAEQYRPIAPQPAPQPAYADQAAEDTCDEQPAAPVLDGQFSFDEQPEEGYYDEQPADDGYYDEQPADDGYCDEQPADDGYYDEQPSDDGYYDEQPADDGYYDEQPEGGYDPNYATDGEEGYYDDSLHARRNHHRRAGAGRAAGAGSGRAGHRRRVRRWRCWPDRDGLHRSAHGGGYAHPARRRRRRDRHRARRGVAGHLAVHPRGHRLGPAARAHGKALVQKGDRRMKKAWKTILIIALCVLIVGEIVLGVGLATGGSPDRIWDAAYEHYDFASVFAFIKSSGIADFLASIGL